MSGVTWFCFADAVRAQASRLSDSDLPMVFVLPDGRELEPRSVSADLRPARLRQGDVEYDGYKYVIRLTQEEDDGKGDQGGR